MKCTGLIVLQVYTKEVMLSTHIRAVLQDGGRVVNVCSMAGKLRIIKSHALQERFVNAASSADVEVLATKFVDDVRAGRYEATWPSP